VFDRESEVGKRQARGPIRAATAECADCHFVFEKPFMHETFDLATPGRYVPSRTTTSRDRYGNVRGTSQTDSGYTSGTYKKAWLCETCHELRARARRRNWWIGIGAITPIAFGIFVLVGRQPRADPEAAPSDKYASVALLDQQQQPNVRVVEPQENQPAVMSAEPVRGELMQSDPSVGQMELPAAGDGLEKGFAADEALQNQESASVTAMLFKKVTQKLAKSERREQFDWSTRARGVKFRVLASEKTVSEGLECRNLRFQIEDGSISSFEPDQLWCKLEPDRVWTRQNAAS